MTHRSPKRITQRTTALVIWLVLFIGAQLGLLACHPPLAPGQKLIRSVRLAPNEVLVTLDEKLWQLGEISYPLRITAGPMNADATLPQPDQAGTKTISLGDQKTNIRIPINDLHQEGGLAIWDKEGKLIDQITFVSFPTGATLVRDEQGERYCAQEAWQQSQTCNPVQRDTKATLSRLRVIRSQDDFLKLAKDTGQQSLQIQEVKVVVDLERNALPHYLNSVNWELHYTWYRAEIEKKASLDRCDAEQNKAFLSGWTKFSEENYTRTDTRRFLLATVIYYKGPNEYAIELSPGDRIKYVQLVQLYKVLRASFPTSAKLSVRPVSEEQKRELFHTNKNNIPVMPVDLPYQGQTVQLLSPGVAYGKLLALSASEVATHPLGLRVIALLKEVPNDINFVGGIISNHFQSALSHINVLSRNRGTPHLVIREALSDTKVKALLGKLVRLEVKENGYTLREATEKEANAFWQEKSDQHKPWTPTLDLKQQDLVDLGDASYKDSTTIGAKAANMAELMNVSIAGGWHGVCRQFDYLGGVPLPKKPMAIPFYWYNDHLERAGMKENVQQWHQEQSFLNDPVQRRKRLEQLREAILKTPVNPTLLAKLKEEITKRYGQSKVRFRSSTNVEDLPNFNGAGLYTSKSAAIGHPTKTISLALQTVWASLWSERAWNERQFYKIDHRQAAMGILVHPSFNNESANGVAISTNIFNPSYTSDTYIAVQKGEVSVVNPEGNVTPDQFLIRWYESPETVYMSNSSLTYGKPVLEQQEIHQVGCYMQAIHSHFQRIFGEKDKPFAMDVEFKIHKTPRTLAIKQARPYIFGEHQGKDNTCKEP